MFILSFLTSPCLSFPPLSLLPLLSPSSPLLSPSSPLLSPSFPLLSPSSPLLSLFSALLFSPYCQTAAVSVCQFLASEVHKPLKVDQTPQPKLPKKKPHHPSGSTSPTTTTSKKTAPQPKPVKSTDPPPPVVSQIMEMGFPRRHIEYAMQVRRLTQN